MTDTTRSDTYSKSAFDAIAGDELNDFLEASEYPSRRDDRPLDSVRIDEQGVWVHQRFDISWTPICEIEGRNPRDEPALPFPFSAQELAAFLIDGVGYFIRDMYGKWADGPNQSSIDRLCAQDLAAAAPALRAAYDAYRAAEHVIGEPPRVDTDDLADQLMRVSRVKPVA